MHYLASSASWSILLVFIFALVPALVPALVAPSHALAGPLSGFVEMNAALVVPSSDERYDELFASGTQLGVRAGPMLAVAHYAGEASGDILVGLDLGADYAWLGNGKDDDFAPTWTRWRVTAGPRVAIRAGRATLFGRFAAGFERINMDNHGLLEAFCGDISIDAKVLEAGVGVAMQAGLMRFGLEVDRAWADHRDDRPGCGTLGSIDVLDTNNVDDIAKVFVGVQF